MKILILGGTRFFGKDIAKVFHEAGHSVTLFTRGNAIPPDLPPCAYLKGDRKRPEDLKRAAAFGWDVLIDNLAYTGDDVRLALEAFKSIPHYILTSTVSVYKYAPQTQPLLETTVQFDSKPPEEDMTNVHWSYARGKLDAEKRLRDSGLSWTIFRPSVVHGPFDPLARGFWYFARMRKGGPLLLPNGGAASFRLVYSKDIARAYLAAAETHDSRGRTYNLASEEIITLREFLDDSAVAMGVKPDYVDIPRALIGDMAGPHGDLVNFIPSTEAAKRELKYRPTPWKEYGVRTARWFVEEWRGDEAELLKGRDAELTLAKKFRELSSSLPVAPRP